MRTLMREAWVRRPVGILSLLWLLFVATSITLGERNLLLAAPWFPVGLGLGRVLSSRRWFKRWMHVVVPVGYILLAHWTTYAADTRWGTDLLGVGAGRVNPYALLLLRPWCYAGFWAGVGVFLGLEGPSHVANEKATRDK